MSGSPPAPDPDLPPKTIDLMLATFADLYRHEVGAVEDVYRTLPFFGTALGIVIGALAYAAGRLPKWIDLATHRAEWAFAAAAALLGLAIVEACCVLIFLSRAIAHHDYPRVGPEPALSARLAALQALYAARGIVVSVQDEELLKQMRATVLDSFAEVTPAIRALNKWRARFRASASSHLVRALIWALGATTVIFIADKLGYLPRVMPWRLRHGPSRSPTI